jgi:hypothetical protein
MDRSTAASSSAHRFEPEDGLIRRARRVAITVTLAVAALLAPFVLFNGTDSPARTAADQAATDEPQPLTMITSSPFPSVSTTGSSATPGTSDRPSPSRTVVGGPAASQPAGSVLTTGVFFDDFAYTGVQDAAFVRSWDVRDYAGGPGSTGAKWSPSAISIGGSVMTMTATTDGTAAGTTESEVDSHRPIFLNGTFAVRIRFTTAPNGPAGAHVNETLFALSNNGESDPNYSEVDVGYQPAGSADDTRTQLDLTSWRSGSQSVDNVLAAEYDGWHTIVITVGSGTVTYYVDGASVFTSSGAYYPREKMLLAFNEWFNDGEFGPSGAARTYTQQVDWTYSVAGLALSPTQVQQQVDGERSAGRTFVDNVAG